MSHDCVGYRHQAAMTFGGRVVLLWKVCCTMFAVDGASTGEELSSSARLEPCWGVGTLLTLALNILPERHIGLASPKNIGHCF
jgi:hypothetical protein